jgi:hypothetical protein
MPPQEKTTRQARSSPDGRAQAGIAGERPDGSPSSGPTGPASQRALFGFTHAGTAADGDDARHEPHKHDTYEMSQLGLLSACSCLWRSFTHTLSSPVGYRRHGQVASKNRKKPSTGRSFK